MSKTQETLPTGVLNFNQIRLRNTRFDMNQVDHFEAVCGFIAGPSSVGFDRVDTFSISTSEVGKYLAEKHSL